jgi:hypothetical protein
MTKNPILNALAAALYIAAVASVIYTASPFAAPVDTILIPIALLSLFSLSAAVMGFIFFYRPITMYFEGEKKPAIRLGIQTIGAFAVITAILLASLLLQVFFHG